MMFLGYSKLAVKMPTKKWHLGKGDLEKSAMRKGFANELAKIHNAGVDSRLMPSLESVISKLKNIEAKQSVEAVAQKTKWENRVLKNNSQKGYSPTAPNLLDILIGLFL
jgi:hypothetical protein